MAASSQELSETDETIIDLSKRDGIEKDLCLGTILAIHEYDLENEARNYLSTHLSAGFWDIDKYIMSLCPPLEIVDDEE